MNAIGFIQDREDPQNNFSTLVPTNFTHACAIGQTGCGKTSSFIYPNLKYRIQQGHAILLYDFKGKEHLSLKYFAQEHDRLDDVVEVGKPWGAKINLIRLMDEETLGAFVKSSTGHTETNNYWASSASKLFLSVYNIIISLEKIHKESQTFQASSVFKNALHYEKNLDFDAFDYPCTLSFRSVMEICQSEAKLAPFSKNLRDLQRRIQRLVVYIIKKEESSKQKKVHTFIDLLKNVTRLQEANKQAQSALSAYTKIDGENPKVSIMMTLLPLVSIANRAEFNTDSYDLLDALQKKKIISINAKDMSDELIEGLTYALFQQFSKRSMLHDVTPVSVFIDEAQRVITANQDHNLDVLRECKVEMFLAYQNEELMQNKMGANIFKAMKQNLKSTFYFTNEEQQNDLDLLGLKSFECVSSLNNYAKVESTTPIFIPKERSYKIENIYQKKLNVFKEYSLSTLQTESILLFDAKYFAQNQLLSYSLKSQKTKVVNIFTPEEKKEVLDFYAVCEEIIAEENKLLERDPNDENYIPQRRSSR